MNADRVIKMIKVRLGDPSVGAVHDVMPVIEDAVREAFTKDPTGGESKKEHRVVKAEETRTQ